MTSGASACACLEVWWQQGCLRAAVFELHTLGRAHQGVDRGSALVIRLHVANDCRNRIELRLVELGHCRGVGSRSEQTCGECRGHGGGKVAGVHYSDSTHSSSVRAMAVVTVAGASRGGMCPDSGST